MAETSGLFSKGRVVLVAALLFASTIATAVWFGAKTVRLSFEADSLRAANDTTKIILGNKIKGLSDSLTVAHRLVIQTEQQRDALDKALRQEHASKAAVTVTLPKVDSTVKVAVVDDDSIRIAHAELHQPPFHIAADIELPRPPADGTVTFDLAVEPIKAGFRFGCGSPINGVRPATVAISGPEWLRFRIDSASQEPGVCNPRLTVPLSTKLKYATFGAAVLAGFKLLVDFVAK